MEIRPIRGRPDVRGAFRVNRAAWCAASAHVVSDEVLSRLAADPTEADVDRWRDALDDTDAAERVLVADRTSPSGDPEVVGYAHVRWDDTKEFVRDDEAGVTELYVDPDCWREGVGSALLSRALDAVPPEYSAVKLETLAGNRRGRAFYEAEGFEHAGASSFELLGRTYPTVVYARTV